MVSEDKYIVMDRTTSVSSKMVSKKDKELSLTKITKTQQSFGKKHHNMIVVKILKLSYRDPNLSITQVPLLQSSQQSQSLAILVKLMPLSVLLLPAALKVLQIVKLLTLLPTSLLKVKTFSHQLTSHQVFPRRKFVWFVKTKIRQLMQRLRSVKQRSERDDE